MSALAAPVASARSGLARGMAGVGMWLGIGLAAPIVVLVTFPVLFGFHFVTILSGSMTPTLGVGDVVVEKRVSPLQVKVGDVITFPAPGQKQKTYTHRVVSMHLQPGGRIAFVTQGDANPSSESWAVKADGTLGLARFHIGKLGYITNRAGSRMGRLALLVIPILLLGIYEFRRIWFGEDDDEAEDAAAS